MVSSENSKEVEKKVIEREDKKSVMLKNFKIAYLEEMLNSSTKSVAREVVSTLVKENEVGTL